MKWWKGFPEGIRYDKTGKKIQVGPAPDGVEHMNGIDKNFTSIQQVTDQYLTQKSEAASDASRQLSFEEVLRSKQSSMEPRIEARIEARSIQPLRFSKHAAMRLMDRNISLSKEQSERLESGVRKAGEKGIHDSLVIVDSLAFIVNVPNKTVVTAMEQGETDRNIFTNIDGAVII